MTSMTLPLVCCAHTVKWTMKRLDCPSNQHEASFSSMRCALVHVLLQKRGAHPCHGASGHELVAMAPSASPATSPPAAVAVVPPTMLPEGQKATSPAASTPASKAPLATTPLATGPLASTHEEQLATGILAAACTQW